MANLNAELHEQSDERARPRSPVTLALAEGRSLINIRATTVPESKNNEDEAVATRSALPGKMSKKQGEDLSEGDKSGDDKAMNEVSKDEASEGVKNDADGLLFSGLYVSVFKLHMKSKRFKFSHLQDV